MLKELLVKNFANFSDRVSWASFYSVIHNYCSITLLSTELYGSKQDLEVTASFVSLSGMAL
jgi:hypothetical protein